MGLSMVGTLASKQHEELFMGIWFITAGIGSLLSGYLSEIATPHIASTSPMMTNPIYGYHFCAFGLIALLCASVLTLLAQRLAIK